MAYPDKYNVTEQLQFEWKSDGRIGMNFGQFVAELSPGATLDFVEWLIHKADEQYPEEV